MKKIIRNLLLLLILAGLSQITYSQEIVIPNGELAIGGTLELPENHSEGKPLVILITGSGAQDRDETILGFKPFKDIADHLIENNIASFRYDDRQIGASTGDFAQSTLDDLADDVIAIMDYFQNQADSKFDDFILLGHSQGGAVSAKVIAKDERVSGIIFMASYFVPLKDVINEQVTLIQRASGKSEEDIQFVLEFQEKAYETARTNEGWDELKVEFQNLIEREINKLPEAQQQFIGDMAAFSEAQFNAQVTPFRAPQMRSLLHYNPANDVKGTDVPILAIFGEKDTQVTPSQNEKVIVQLCENEQMNCTINSFKDANHLFQKANSGFVNEYGMLPKEFVDGFLESISDWVLEIN